MWTRPTLVLVALVSGAIACRPRAIEPPPASVQPEPPDEPEPPNEPKLSETEATSQRHIPLTFEHDHFTLRGVLVRPSGEGPFPVAVFVHGDGPAQRDGFGLYPPVWEALAEIGVASVAWDSPGTGESEGDWTQRSFRDRAAETLVAMAHVRSHPDIDSARVGLWGISQAGWVIPMMAEDAAFSAAFVICVSCPGGNLFEQGRYLLAQNLLRNGFAEFELAHALAVYDTTRDVQARPDNNKALRKYQRARAEHETRRWMSDPAAVALLPETPRIFGADAFIDPRPLLPDLGCPVLAIYGALDSQVDPLRGRTTYEAAAGQLDVTVETIPDANHALLTAKTGTLAELATFFGQDPLPYAPEYLPTLKGWLSSALAVSRRAAGPRSPRPPSGLPAPWSSSSPDRRSSP